MRYVYPLDPFMETLFRWPNHGHGCTSGGHHWRIRTSAPQAV